jgi:hypothetical protein
MLAVLRGPIEVEVVGGGADLIDFLGPALIALAAVFAAWLAAHTANRRQQEQLNHDRSLRERELLRNTLDEVVESATRCIRELSEFSARGQVGDKQQDEGSAEDKLDALAVELMEAEDRTHALTLEMWSNTLRLHLRLPEKHPITISHEELVDACRAWYKTLAATGTKRRRTAEQVAAESDAKDAASAAFSVFMDASRDWFTGARNMNAAFGN